MAMSNEIVQNISDFLLKAVANENNPLFNKEIKGVSVPKVVNNVTCHENTATILIDNSKIYEEKKREMSNREKALNAMIPNFCDENIKDEDIKKAIQICGNSVSNLQCKFEDGTIRYFTSNTKGTRRYNLKKKQQIEDAILYYQQREYETFGLTLTCNPTVYSNIPFVSWKHFKADYSSLFKFFTEKLHGKYVLVMESTKKGYPHAHLFLAFPKGTIKGYDKMPIRKALKYGYLANQIKRRIKHPIFNLQKVAGKHLKNYMSKYIGKMSDVNLFSLAQKEEGLTDAEKKVCLCHIFTTITKTRQFVSPITNRAVASEVPGAVDRRNRAEQSETLDKGMVQDLWEELAFKSPNSIHHGFARLRAYLIRLCTNSPCYFKNDVRIMSQRKFERLFSVPIEEMQHQTAEMHERFKLNSACLTCGGCFHSHLARFIRDKKDEWFDNVLWFENGACQLAFTDEVKQDDDLFMHRLAWWTEYALSNLHLANCKISVFFKDANKQKVAYIKSRIKNSYLAENIQVEYFRLDDNDLLKIGKQKRWID